MELKKKTCLIEENKKLLNEIDLLEERENQILNANFNDFSEMGKKMIDYKIGELKRKSGKEEEKIQFEMEFFENELNEKLDEFLQRYESAKKENDTLKSQNKRLNDENNYYEEINNQLEGKIRRKKIIENYLN